MFLFIAKCKLLNRNKAQVASIFCNFKDMQKQAPWLREFISKCAGSLKKTQTNPITMQFFIKPLYHDPILTRMICKNFNIVFQRKPRKKKTRKLSYKSPSRKVSRVKKTVYKHNSSRLKTKLE